jgi:hypothetical protein
MQKQNNVHYDALGRQFRLGDTILARGYGSTTMSTITTVDSITKTRIRCAINARRYVWDSSVDKYVVHTEADKSMYRHPKECVIINEQLAYNHETYPELYI